MKYSILVPVYNVEDYLRQCIESVLNQTYQNFELILVNDGSKDKSGIICDEYAKNYPEKIKAIHKENGGLISARRVGIASATGDYCIFLDSDDFIESKLLETLEDYLNKEELDVLIYSFQYCKDGVIEKRNQISVTHEMVWDEANKKDIYTRLIGGAELTSIWTKAIRTSILQKESIDYSVYYGKNMGEDLLQSLYPITEAKRIMFIDKPLYDYRINEESISRSFTIKTIPSKNMLHVYEKIREYLPLWDMEDRDTLDRLNARWFNETMYMMCKYYENAKSQKEKEAIIDYNWNELLPEGAYNPDNKYENEAYKSLYVWIEKRDYKSIHRYFRKKNFYERYKKVKRDLKECLKRNK